MDQNNFSTDTEISDAAKSPSNEGLETAATRTLKDNFMFFGPVTIAYAIFYAFCMYKNEGGIAFPFFVIGSLGFLFLCISKLGLTLKKGNLFTIISVLVISVSATFTNDPDLIAIDEFAVFILVICEVIRQFYDTDKWQFGKYFTVFFRQIFGALSCIFRPFTDAYDYNHSKTRKSSKRFFYILLGILIAIPVLILVLALLSAADAVFREALHNILDGINFSSALNIVWHIVYWFFFTYMLLAYTCRHKIHDEVTDRRTIDPLIAITATSLLTLVYIIFSGIQIAYLFTGSLSLPEGYTYAEYAREGFYQLMWVSIINLVIVIVCLTFFRENKALRIILTVFSACTYVMIFSAALRMIMYIRYYYLTTDRILVLWCLCVLTILFIGVIINIYKPGFKLFGYFKVTVTLFYIVLAFARPDYIVARVDLSRAAVSDEVSVPSDTFFLADAPYDDFDYISDLSLDAATPITEFLSGYDYDFSIYNDSYKLDRKIELLNLAREEDEVDCCYYYPDVNSFGYYYMQRFVETEEEMTLRTYNFSIANAIKQFNSK